MNNTQKDIIELCDQVNDLTITQNKNYKTKMCSQFINKGICKRKNCNFAHTYDELIDRMCGYDRKCRNQKCEFKHSWENQEEYRKRIGIDRDTLLEREKEKKKQEEKTHRTKMCPKMLDEGYCGKKWNSCTFAHTYNELVDRMCGYDTKCRNERCQFKHSWESQKVYRERTGIAELYGNTDYDEDDVTIILDIDYSVPVPVL